MFVILVAASVERNGRKRPKKEARDNNIKIKFKV